MMELKEASKIFLPSYRNNKFNTLYDCSFKVNESLNCYTLLKLDMSINLQ